MFEKFEYLKQKHSGINKNLIKDYVSWLNNNEDLTGGEKAYKYVDDLGQIYRLVAMGAPEKRTHDKYFIPLIHPVTRKPCPVPSNGWSRTPENMNNMITKGLIIFGKDEKSQPQKKVNLKYEKQISSVIREGKSGKSFLDHLGVTFPYSHPVSLYDKLLSSNNSKLVLDYFAGSGTTAHSVINLNREDNGNRKYILIEMGEYFDEVTKPRIQKVIYSKDWKDGKPVSREGSSHCFKYIRLESYEDTLNNLELKRDGEKQSSLDFSEQFKEDYMLSYMLDVETNGSASLLNTEWFTNPFDYKLKVIRNNETQTVNVDLPETFNYLIGLVVESIDVLQGFKVIIGKNLQNEKILIIWRNTQEKNNKALDDFFLKQQYNTRDNEFDRIYVNGDNNLENLKMSDEKWKVILIEEELKKRMFDVKEF